MGSATVVVVVVVVVDDDWLEAVVVVVVCVNLCTLNAFVCFVGGRWEGSPSFADKVTRCVVIKGSNKHAQTSTNRLIFRHCCIAPHNNKDTGITTGVRDKEAADKILHEHLGTVMKVSRTPKKRSKTAKSTHNNEERSKIQRHDKGRIQAQGFRLEELYQSRYERREKEEREREREPILYV